MLFILFLLVGCNQTAFSIEKVKDKKIESFMGRLIFESERKFENFNFRAFSEREDGECDGSPASCPTLNYYLVISTIDEYPDRAVYVLPPSQDWELIEINEIDAPGEFERHIIVSLVRTIPSSDLSKGWWKKITYQVKVSPWVHEVIEP